ncbi:hypothetical protein BJ170DRAFT_203834 [Xylariales sp. AK1849]|nr:hypothetical protein BJ170DRAFT_203834 [Xylariales sp. AK1849]
MLLNFSLIPCALLLLSLPSLATAEDKQAAIEAVVTLPGGTSPRYYMGALPALQLVKRQEFYCAAGNHTCLELGVLGSHACCPNDKYCFFNEDWSVGCCGLGAKCDTCPDGFFRSNNTVTLTSQTTAGTSTVLQSLSTSVNVACLARPCSVAAFKCASQFGGGCCNNGEFCATSSCNAPVPSTPTLVPTQSGCSGTSYAFSCTDGGCCQNGQTCTLYGGLPGCTGTPDPLPGTNVTSSDALSQGAKAGIGAGVAVGAALVIGAVTWFCIRQRRERTRRSSAYLSRQSQRAPPGDVTTEVSGPARPGPHRDGLAYDYFGPAAVPGPYTQQEGTPHETPSVLGRAVPARPRGPNDITAPVEIDSRLWASDAPSRGANTPSAAASVAQTPAQEEGPFELYGSLGTPSPLSPDEMGQRRSTTGSPDPISPAGGTS